MTHWGDYLENKPEELITALDLIKKRTEELLNARKHLNDLNEVFNLMVNELEYSDLEIAKAKSAFNLNRPSK